MVPEETVPHPGGLPTMRRASFLVVVFVVVLVVVVVEVVRLW